MSPSRPFPKDPPPPVEPTPSLLPPTQEQWDKLSPTEREEVQGALLAAQEDFDSTYAQPESDHHYDAKEDIRRTLRDFFDGGDRGVYIGAERAVFYPGEPGFTPDLIIVVDVPTYKRDCWMVSAEGRGPDVIIELHYKGKWKKDFVDNVRRFARLGIPEYYVFDVGRQILTAYHLPPSGGAYEQVRLGRVHSRRLGLELVVRRGRLHFSYRGALLPNNDERFAALTETLEQEQARAEHEAARAEQEAARAEQEAARAEQEATRAEQEAARAEHEAARAERSLSGLRGVFFAMLSHRGISLSAEQGLCVHGCTDAAVLQRWCERALTARDADELLQDG